MIGYSATDYFSARPALIELWKKATLLVAAIAEPNDPDEIRCHELTRAVAARLAPQGPLNPLVSDGLYGAVDHSWLVVYGDRRVAGQCDGGVMGILDCYAVARLPMVQLVDVAPWPTRQSQLYKAGPYRTDIREDVVRALLARWDRVFTKFSGVNGVQP